MNLSWFGVQGGIVYTSSSNSIFLTHLVQSRPWEPKLVYVLLVQSPGQSFKETRKY